MKRSNELNVNGTIVRVIRHNEADYVCITDIAALKNPIEPKDVVKNWMRSRATISFLGLWEKLGLQRFLWKRAVHGDRVMRYNVPHGKEDQRWT